MPNQVDGMRRDFNQLRAELEEFRQSPGKELLLRPIERWMIENLGVKRLPNRGGSAIIYRHEILMKYRGPGNDRFKVDIVHPAQKKREKIYAKYFDIHLLKPLRMIIECLEMEEKSESSE